MTVIVDATALPSQKPSLHRKLAEVMALTERVAKRGRNDFHKYDYATESDIVEAVRLGLAERHIMLIPAVREVLREGTLTTVLMRFTFTDGETGEQEGYDWAGTGDDKGDKGLYKAMTGALKYFLLKTFLLPTGDDPEADTETDKRAEGQAPATRHRTSKGTPTATGPTCTRCGGQAVPGSPYCATCGRLAGERAADDAKAKAANEMAAYVMHSRLNSAAVEPLIAKHGWVEPVGDLRAERNRAFGLMNLHGFTAGEPGRKERLLFYAKALGRSAITEAQAKTMTPEEWRVIGERVKKDNEPPAEDQAPMGVEA